MEKVKDNIFHPIKKFLKRYGWDYLFIGPDIIVFFTFIVIPLILAIILAFKDFQIVDGILNSPWNGTENFKSVFEDEVFWISLKNTGIYTIILVPIGIIIALFLSSLIYPLKEKQQTFYRAAYYLPGVASAVVMSMVWKWIFDPDFGLFNTILGKIGLGPYPWLTSPDMSLFSIMLAGILTPPGMSIILYLATMGKIPPALYEAAEIDGATRFQKWWKITVPLVKPTTLYLLVTHTIGSFQVFTNVYIMTNGGPGYSSTVLVHQIFEKAFTYFNFGEASAQALILFVIICFFAIIQFKFLSTDVEY